MTRFLSLGGVLASALLIVLGIGAIVVGASGRSEVRDNVQRERITGTPDMTPSASAAAINAAGVKGVELPSCSVANQPVKTGSQSKCFADYIRVHALEATGGKTYAQMPRFMGKNGKPTEDEKQAARDPKTGKPVDNPQRNIWVTATALSTALNTSFFAERVALFSIVMGIALVLTGIGFLVLSLGLLPGRRARGGTNA